MIETWFFECYKSWSVQCKVVITATTINVINTIWYCRNRQIFVGVNINWCTIANL